MKLTRRSWLGASGIATLAASVAGVVRVRGQSTPPAASYAHGSHGAGHGLGTIGRVDKALFDPVRFLRAWNFNDLPPDERSRHYRETTRPDGTLLREYEIFSVDREIEIAPGVFFPAWT